MNFKELLLKITRIPLRLRVCFYLHWNRIILHINDIKYGRNVRIFNHIYIKKDKQSSIQIGDNLIFSSGDALNPLCRNIRGCIYAYGGSKIEIGNNVGLSSTCIWAKNHIIIKDYVNIGGDCILLDTDAHNLDYRIRMAMEIDEKGKGIDSESAKSAPIVIEENVLIGTRCIILKGVTIGARSIIGSGSIVTKSIPADCIAAGNPARPIRFINK